MTGKFKEKMAQKFKILVQIYTKSVKSTMGHKNKFNANNGEIEEIMARNKKSRN